MVVQSIDQTIIAANRAFFTLIHNVRKLRFVKIGIKALLRKKLLMRALLDDVAVLDDQDEIGVFDRRCAMTNEVRPSIRPSIAFWMRSSVRVSTDEVASSRMSMRLLAKKARAMVKS